VKKLIGLLAVFFVTRALSAQPSDTVSLLKMKAPDVYCVQMTTNIGTMVFEVNSAWGPLAADRFYQLVASGFYYDSRIFRSTKKYLQFGINNDGAINSFWERHPIKDEPVIQKNMAGTISFAKGGPDSRTSSVYFNKIDNPKLDTLQKGLAFPAFGKIIQDQELLAKFENKYPDSIVFKHWDGMASKGNTYTDKVLPGLSYIISMDLVSCQPPHQKLTKKRK
jgi:cyclophilin family peptidyl-prolyl cis-trans isomerase